MAKRENKTCPAQQKASRRKKKNRQMKQQALEAEAAEKKLPVWEIKFQGSIVRKNKSQEVFCPANWRYV